MCYPECSLLRGLALSHQMGYCSGHPRVTHHVVVAEMAGVAAAEMADVAAAASAEMAGADFGRGSRVAAVAVAAAASAEMTGADFGRGSRPVAAADDVAAVVAAAEMAGAGFGKGSPAAAPAGSQILHFFLFARKETPHSGSRP